MSLSRRSLLARSLGGAFSLPLLSLPARAATHQVAIRGMAFEPATLTIAIGDSVTFTNEDSAPHTATATNDAFDTGRLGRGDAASLTFSAAGRFDYACAIHSSMTGAITVG